jgi:hypothetical protein
MIGRLIGQGNLGALFERVGQTWGRNGRANTTQYGEMSPETVGTATKMKRINIFDSLENLCNKPIQGELWVAAWLSLYEEGLENVWLVSDCVWICGW